MAFCSLRGARFTIFIIYSSEISFRRILLRKLCSLVFGSDQYIHNFCVILASLLSIIILSVFRCTQSIVFTHISLKKLSNGFCLMTWHVSLIGTKFANTLHIQQPQIWMDLTKIIVLFYYLARSTTKSYNFCMLMFFILWYLIIQSLELYIV